MILKGGWTNPALLSKRDLSKAREKVTILFVFFRAATYLHLASKIKVIINSELPHNNPNYF